MTKLTYTIVIPAYNEERTIGKIVGLISSEIKHARILVVDNNSKDNTGIAARDAGAEVLLEPQVGFGYALLRGFSAAKTDFVIKTDADIKNFSADWIQALICENENGAKLARAIFSSDYDEFPVTNLAFRPLARHVLPDIEKLERPLSGTYSVKLDCLNLHDLPRSWAFDLAILHQIHISNLKITEVPIGVLSDAKRSIEYYKPMANDIVDFLLGIAKGKYMHSHPLGKNQ